MWHDTLVVGSTLQYPSTSHLAPTLPLLTLYDTRLSVSANLCYWLHLLSNSSATTGDALSMNRIQAFDLSGLAWTMIRVGWRGVSFSRSFVCMVQPVKFATSTYLPFILQTNRNFQDLSND